MSTERKTEVLILLAHPRLHESKVNRLMADAVRDLPNVRLNDLYKEYPDFKIDIKREQALLVKADVIVFQFPLYWYSSPSILKEWQDVVLEWGFAFGKDGDKLKNKDLVVALSTGGPEEAYQEGGQNNFGIADFLETLSTDCGFL
jgi:putative NADPH-quinone reductase